MCSEFWKELRIVVPEAPTPRESFAAEELAKYLKRIFGADVGICAGEGRYSILIGAPQRNAHTAERIAPEEFRRVCPGPEGLFIRSFGEDTLVLAGSDGDMERGVIYAVYEFLERFLGASLAAYSAGDVDAGEVLPRLETFTLAGYEYVKPAADLPYRTAVVQYGDEEGNADRKLNLPFLDWMCKNRYNRIETWTGCYEQFRALGILPEAERRGIRFTVGHHSVSKFFLPPHGNRYFPEHYYETHPEYYKLLADGTRYESLTSFGQWIFCSRDPGVTETLAANICAWVRENPLVDVIFFPPNDGMDAQCCCPECAKHSKVENYLHVLTGVIERVNREFPDMQIQMLAYVDLFECPRGVRLNRSLSVQEATWHSTGLRRVGKADGSCLLNTFFEENLLRWKDAGAAVTYYDYHMGVYGGRQRWIPMADELQPMFRGFRERGIDGTATQIECFNLWNHAFNFYAFGRTGYDTELSMEDNLARFTRIFGEGAGEIAEIIRYGEAALDGEPDIAEAGSWLQGHIDRARVYALYDAALAKAKTPRARNNIRLMRMEFRYSDLTSGLKCLQDRYVPVAEYDEPTGELALMTEFDSFWRNDPGYGIAIPGRSVTPAVFEKTGWYRFE